MRRRMLIEIVAFCATIVFLATIPCEHVQAQAQKLPTVYILPKHRSVNVREKFWIGVFIKDVVEQADITGLLEWTIRLQYNPNAMEYIGEYEYGKFLNPAKNLIHPLVGADYVHAAQQLDPINDPRKAATGGGLLFKVRFHCKRKGAWGDLLYLPEIDLLVANRTVPGLKQPIGKHVKLAYVWQGLPLPKDLPEPPGNGTDGGIVVPVDQFSLLAPHIGLYSATLVATVATAMYAKRLKRKKEK